MAQRRGKRIGLPHPAVSFAAAGLLLGATFNAMIRSAPRTRLASAPPASAPAAAGRPLAPSGPAATLAGRPALPSAGDEPGKSSADLHAALPAPDSPVMPPPGLVGPPAPARGPEWKRAPLPVISPEVLQAMLNPRAVRRARHLRRLGLVPPPEPALTPDRPIALARQRVAGPASPKRAAAGASVVAAVSRSAPSHQASGREAAGDGASAPMAVARLEHPELGSHGQARPAPAAQGTAVDPGRTPAAAQPAVGSESSPPEVKPGGESAGKETTGSAAPPAASRAPIRLQARLDHPRSEYQAGEWVAVRFLASQPVHLRVYRVDSAGHVTRVFSTYSRDDRGSPARTFSMMVKAGEPQPGPEGMVAIGSARPLTRDELLACLRAYLAEGPASSAAPAGSAAAPPAAQKGGTSTAEAPPLADVLKTVIDAVGSAADMPEAPAAPLDRSAWSIAVGRFTSAERKVSAASGPRSVKEASGGS